MGYGADDGEKVIGFVWPNWLRSGLLGGAARRLVVFW